MLFWLAHAHVHMASYQMSHYVLLHTIMIALYTYVATHTPNHLAADVSLTSLISSLITMCNAPIWQIALSQWCRKMINSGGESHES